MEPEPASITKARVEDWAALGPRTNKLVAVNGQLGDGYKVQAVGQNSCERIVSQLQLQ